MTVEEIKPGHVFYVVDSINTVTKYMYHSPFPMKDNCYHILINRRIQEPERIYKDVLQVYLDMNLNTYEEAQKYILDNLEDMVYNIKKRMK